MSYRFMVEVPGSERGSAEIAIGSAPDTQIVVTRASFAEGYDNPIAALTIASENLRVVDTIYSWQGSFHPEKPDVRFVLHSGKRLTLADHTSGSMIAAIRSDQPWVEHAIPRIGDHAEEEFVSENAVATSESSAPEKPKTVVIDHVNFVAVNVMDLRRAEEFYTSFFDMEIVGRTRTSRDGKYQLIHEPYDWEKAIVTETVADDSFLRNGSLTLALHRVGVGARLERSVVDRISIQVDAASFSRVKAKALMSSFEVLGESQASFSFRDPFGIPWEISLAGLLPHILHESLIS